MGVASPRNTFVLIASRSTAYAIACRTLTSVMLLTLKPKKRIRGPAPTSTLSAAAFGRKKTAVTAAATTIIITTIARMYFVCFSLLREKPPVETFSWVNLIWICAKIGLMSVILEQVICGDQLSRRNISQKKLD